jgi:hydrogenase expression/formation protein HypC
MCLGIPGQIVSVSDPTRLLAVVEVAGTLREINSACILEGAQAPESCIGDWVLVHVGFAMSRIDELEAARTLELLRELGEAHAEIAAMQSDTQGSTGQERGGP